MKLLSAVVDGHRYEVAVVEGPVKVGRVVLGLPEVVTEECLGSELPEQLARAWKERAALAA